MSVHILFEGLDLAGKSTTTRNFIEAADLGTPWELREKTIVTHNPIRNSAVEVKKDERLTDITVGWLHYASFLGDLDVYEPPTHPVAQESVTAFRSIAYHTIFGDKDLAAKFVEKLSELDIFSDVFLITAGIEARQHRLEQRRRKDPRSVSFLDELVRLEPVKFIDMENIMFDSVYQATSAQVHIIDTSELKLQRVTDVVVNHLMAPTLFEPDRYLDLQLRQPSPHSVPLAEAV